MMWLLLTIIGRIEDAGAAGAEAVLGAGSAI
jgi:hypothetical protein